MRTYQTSEVARLIGIHPNTVRLYEELKLIPKPQRQPNGYRVFTDLHLAQIRLVRSALQIEVLQNGLRKKIMEAVKASARGDYDGALALVQSYLKQLREEEQNAAEAAAIAARRLSEEPPETARRLRRKEASVLLGISMDSLRNWEMNGLLQVKRRENGYRVYSGGDLNRLKIIRSLRCGGYSLEAILRMLTALSKDPGADVQKALDTPHPDEDVVTVCDRLMSSLKAAGENAETLLKMLREMKRNNS